MDIPLETYLDVCFTSLPSSKGELLSKINNGPSQDHTMNKVIYIFFLKGTGGVIPYWLDIYSRSKKMYNINKSFTKQKQKSCTLQ